MHLSYVYDAVYPWETGGIQKRVWELSRRLADDHDVHWYGRHYWDGPEVIEREGVTLHGVGEPGDIYVDGRRSITEALSFGLRLLPELLSGDVEADVVDCQAFPYFGGGPSRLSAWRHDATMCVTWHEVWAEYWYDYLGRPGVCGRAIEAALSRVSDVNVAVSGRTRTDLEALGADCEYVLSNGVDRAEIAGVEPADEPVDVLFVGRLIAEKNADLVVEAVDDLRSEIPDVRCWIVGDGPEYDRLEGLVADRDLVDHVELPGFLEEYRDVLALLRAADVFVLPSQREGFGITVLEALAAGTPVVTIEHPDNAAVELVVEGETGTITARTPGAIAEGIRTARTFSSDRCTESAAPYDWDAVAERADALYREVA